MEELFKFLSEQYIIPFYLIVWLVAMSRYHTYFDTPMKYYPMYLMYTFLTELLGYFIKFHDEFQVVSDSNYDWYNVIIYNIYSVISFAFFYYLYWRLVKTDKYKKWIIVGAVTSLGFLRTKPFLSRFVLFQPLLRRSRGVHDTFICDLALF